MLPEEKALGGAGAGVGVGWLVQGEGEQKVPLAPIELTQLRTQAPTPGTQSLQKL